MSRVLKTEIPLVSVLNNCFPRIDYQDCYCMQVDRGDLQLNDVVRCFFTTAPGWVVNMMKLRDKLGKIAGLKVNKDTRHVSSNPNTSAFLPGEKFGLFQIIERNELEVIMGSDDKHLNFRVSLFLDKLSGNQKRIFISTAVLMHNGFGRSYMKLVAPFHRIVVHGMMNKIYSRLKQAS
ncbi:DUF2867 domain-containing protein [Desertivirga brevis]|uniref:DUF2867 domain-containing protein n=1 Tax=Desertivirga brevis TaxID=2810310 RepID=UPI001A96419F|nr:DUF2867 domain-containing protein [Pedobacter sp. SYSU D00873]